MPLENERIIFSTETPDTESVAEASAESVSGAVSPHEITLSWDDGYDEEMSAGYYGFGLSVSYVWDSGYRFCPLAAPARTKVAVWRAHSEVTFKRITCISARFAGQPVLPNIDTGDPNDLLLSVDMAVESPKELPDGSRMDMISGTYLYLMRMAHDVKGGQPILIPNSVFKINAMQLYPDSFPRTLTPSVAPGDFTGSAITF